MRPRKVRRPRYRPGATQCSRCRCVTTYDRLQFFDQINPKRKLICDDCATVRERLHLS